MKFNMKRIKETMLNNKKTVSAMFIAVLVLFGLSKQTTQAGSTEKGIFGGALTGAAIGGIAGGGRGAGIGALTGAAVGGLIGSSKSSSSSRDPREKELDRLYKRHDKLEKKINNPRTSDSTRMKLQREMKDIEQQIDSIQGRNSRMQRPGGYANRF